ncbi:single-stranded-DNA-specific exonuclease RecJ [Weissella koreensis]|uniref:Single-stranded-DNA-specific exonuclease RecJ n=1 Tax=Weissella koreensis TaxID=165096 RepID=A0A7H1MN30_9LACO|nr:single-stranded-DNA-specific exonuclease RecJ [Weissella koreensis]AVH75662.1 single-stranded-DNA-specific exonuclease RecJ [Weissella koreensis]EJF34649.1 recombination protein J [Weissella koreensis KCTC 3621]QGN20885.1 single-stranded-DNA-specific exonuclease RecJ [Weissella koreensis]QNT64866.1 single-stranded-DNA-specific exonuclease RecJ [Weissella koreensis]
MIEPQYQWQLDQLPQDERVSQLQKQIGAQPLIAQLLVSRGYETPEAVQTFLNPTLDDLIDPYELHDMQKAVDRIFSAVDQGEKIVVYGDYDVDGITATTIMVSALEVLGAEVDYYVPNRFKDGYGPNVEVYKNLAEQGMQLLITVDNGISGKAAIETLMQYDVDVIVTDHHELPTELPSALAIVHPQFPEHPYPFTGLSGAGVAFKVASALLDAPADEWLDLAALGTVADVMPLTGENRTIVKLGLANLNEMQRPGIAALLQLAKISVDKLDAKTIGFQIAPRLNAIGRMDDAKLGVQLLLAEAEKPALELAQTIDQANQERKKLVESIAEAALEQAQNQFYSDSVLVLMGENWHEGVLGIVAARILEATGKPTIVLNQTGTIAKGSGRSLAAFDLFSAMDPHRDLYLSFGGHALAAGMTISVDQVPTVRKMLNEAAVEQAFDYQQKKVITLAGNINSRNFNSDFYEQLQLLGPFGEGNPEPVFALELDGVQNVKTMSEGKHLRFTGMDKRQLIPVVAWQKGALANELQGHFKKMTVVGTLDQNTYRGSTSYQLMVKDIEASGSALIDARTTHLTKPMFSKPATYLFFNHNLQKQLTPLISSAGQAMWWEDAFNVTQIDRAIFVDLPHTLDELHQVLAYVEIGSWETIFYTKNPAYLQKIPTRNDFSKFFKFIQQQNSIDLKNQFQAMEQYLNMDELMLKLLIKVFLDAKFVTIEDDFLKKVEKPDNVDLTTMPSYHNFLQKREVEAKLIYSTTAELEQLLNELAQGD